MSATFRGLAIFLIFGASLYAYAVSYPDPSPGPVSGVVGLYVGSSDVTTNGEAGGYVAVNAHCANKFPGSHICNPMEIINTYNHYPELVDGLVDVLWVNNGPPAFTENIPDDCKGWLASAPSATEQFFGATWNFALDRGTATFCTVSQAFACCK